MSISLMGRKNHSFTIDISEENAGASRLALLLPGVGYRLENPMFFFARQLLIDHGYTIAGANYAYDKVEGFRDFGFDEIMSILADDATTIGNAIADLPKHDELLIVGKSLGTVLMGNMIEQGFLPTANLAWLTPSSKVDAVSNEILANAQRSFICIGTADKGFEEDRFAKFSQAGATICLLPDLAHVLECDNDVPKSILGHHKMIIDLQNWLKAIA